MKKLILGFALVAFSVSFTSCKKCGKCVEDGIETSEEVCQKENKLWYDAMKKSCKDNGGKWE